MALRENAALLAERLAQEARFRSLVQRSSDIITVLDGEARIAFVSPSVERIFESPPDRLLGVRVAALAHRDDRPRLQAFFEEARHQADTAPVTWRVRHPDGTWRHVETVATNMLHDPAVRGVVLNTRDVTERAALEAKLTRQAYRDPLTGLANRASFLENVRRALRDADATERPDRVAVLLLDLDGFKTVNDSLGHAAGDQLLTEVAARLLDATRGSDTVARLGGDEFAVLLRNVRTDDDVVTVAERILGILQTPFTIDGAQAFVGASVGIARNGRGEHAGPHLEARRAGDAPTDGAAAEQRAVLALVRNADVAMYHAKAQGKGQYARFRPDMHAAAVERLALDADFRTALDRGEFRLVYQPVADTDTGEVTGVEALVRWQHPRRGLLEPADFIGFAEETGLIVPLGRWVLNEACRRAAGWHAAQRARDAGARPLTVAVNVSARQLVELEFLHDVGAALGASGLAPETLVLELTESTVVQQPEAMRQRLAALKALGVRLAIDDFGTGYSALSYLQQFPIDVLKIDKAFVERIGHGGAHGALARAIIALGEALSLQCVAEGVETPEQKSILRALGCRLGQGYYFARPLSAEALDALAAGVGALTLQPPSGHDAG
jgi:diguanylate cyclase (GGDEF)-like protein/PAS domain S-box-containing protein